jgi:hypothetical protein
VPARALLGFDGYVDHIQKAVQTSIGDSQEHFQSLTDFGKHIAAAAGKSAQVELQTTMHKFGGNAPIMAHALAQLGASNTCVGTLGYPNLHDSFRQMHNGCTLLSIGEPAMTNALEFGDGKLILSETSTFKDLDLSHVIRLLGKEVLDKAIAGCRLVALVDWANLPKCTLLWEHFYAHLEALGLQDKIFFFDLCDPSKKAKGEIREILSVIGRYGRLGKTILGVNENEALKICRALTDAGPDGAGSPGAEGANHTGKEAAGSACPEPTSGLSGVAKFIFDRIEIDVLLVHPVDCSLIATRDGVTRLPGRVIDQPKILTGGGDNFNAGFCFGLLNDLSLEESALLGMATSGAYVRNGYSPSVTEVINFLNID